MAGSSATARSSSKTAPGRFDGLRVALATCAEIPEGDDEARPLIKALAARDVEARPAVWDDKGIDWSGFDLVVIRSTWDYPARREEFLGWSETLSYVLNRPEVLRWNTDKHYLEVLGTDAVPSDFVPPGATFEPPDWPFVVKPSVGAGSIGAARYEGGDDRARDHVASLHAAGKTVLVQPYLGGVDEHGETSLIYVGGSFSHAVRKTALLAPGSEPGAGLYLEETIAPAEASAAELALGERALVAVPFARSELLYARVDVLPADDRKPLVLEVELTEPSLFIGYAEGAVERFADAVAAASQRRRISPENGPTKSQ